MDLTPYLKDDAVGTLFHDYNLDQVNNMQITKQADVILLFCLFENIFSLGIQEASWDYYLPKTMHDSSLSLSTHVVLAVDLGRNSEAYQLFQKAKNIDLGPYMNSSNDGIHAASLGGIWNSVVEGFGGLRVIDGKLRIEPHLPKEWDSLDYRINWHGARLQISETKEDFTVTFLNSNHLNQIVEFMSKGQKYQVKAKGSLRIKL
ncbi:glycosyl hydrolase family 65 protein [Oenococcus oeni]|uniref:glycosyl hydrolase family 65 protein n=1 Tax=Oenococcus oeni TaxID=1247 RepID=UPI000AF8118C|nr:glycosyl hydrolase family 65 protein [Oenococcus oeni]